VSDFRLARILVILGTTVVALVTTIARAGEIVAAPLATVTPTATSSVRATPRTTKTVDAAELIAIAAGVTQTPSPTRSPTPTRTPTPTDSPTATRIPPQTPGSSNLATAAPAYAEATPVAAPTSSGSLSSLADPSAVSVTVTPSGSPTPSPTATLVPPPPIKYAGIPTTSRDAGWLSPVELWLGIPHRSQFDGTSYAQTNCGPTSLGMVLNAFGLAGYPTDALRGEVNRIQGNSDPDEGTSLPALAIVAQRAGLFPIDLYRSAGVYKRWTIDDVRAHLRAGQPIITLVRYADLPGNGWYPDDTNHYIVLAGLAGDNIIYNDAAYAPGAGRALLMAPEVLQRAWDRSMIPGHAVAFALDAQGSGILSLPPQTAVDEEEGNLVEDEVMDISKAIPGIGFSMVATAQPAQRVVEEPRVVATPNALANTSTGSALVASTEWPVSEPMPNPLSLAVAIGSMLLAAASVFVHRRARAD